MRCLSTNARTLAGLAIAGAVAAGVWQVPKWRAAAEVQGRIEAAANLQKRLEAVVYYRVKSSYIVRDTGEHVDFDYVAACATVVTMYRDGDRSVDTPFGVAPKMMFAPTRDGHAIQLVTPTACNHEVEEGNIPPDLIPLTIFHDNVDNLAFGWGYTSQDAYDNARSRLSFEGASVTAATYADFLAWRAKAASSFTPLGQIRSPWGYSNERGTGLKVSTSCRFYVRTPVFAAGKPALTAEWEKRGKPEFWIHDDGMALPEFWDIYKGERIIETYPHPRTKGGGLGVIQLDANQRSAKKRWGIDKPWPDNDVYPYLPISLSSTPPPTLASTVFPTKVPVSDDWKGLAACGQNDPAIDQIFTNGKFSAYWEGAKLVVPSIGDRTRPFLANDTVVTEIQSRNPHPPRLFFQRDEFLLTTLESSPIEGITN